MDGAIFSCPSAWERWLPAGVRRVTAAGELAGRRWGVLALTRAGCGALAGGEVLCGILLLPGNCRLLPGVRMERAVSYGLSARDSLTFSSLSQPVLCVQRAIPRPDGTVVEPQEIPLGRLPAPAETLLPLLGLLLLSGRTTFEKFS